MGSPKVSLPTLMTLPCINGFEKIVANIDSSAELPNLRFKLRLTVDFLFLQILINFILKVLYFLKMRPIFVSSVHNFGRSDDDMI